MCEWTEWQTEVFVFRASHLHAKHLIHRQLFKCFFFSFRFSSSIRINKPYDNCCCCCGTAHLAVVNKSYGHVGDRVGCFEWWQYYQRPNGFVLFRFVRQSHTNDKKPKEVRRVKALQIDYGRSLCADKDFPHISRLLIRCVRAVSTQSTVHNARCISRKCIDGEWLLGNCIFVLYIERF